MAYSWMSKLTTHDEFFSKLIDVSADFATMQHTDFIEHPETGRIIWNQDESQFERHNGSVFGRISPKIDSESILGVLALTQLPSIPTSKLTGIVPASMLGTGGDSVSFLRKDGTWVSIDPDSDIQLAVDAKEAAFTAKNEAEAAAALATGFQAETNEGLTNLSKKLYVLHTAMAFEVHKLNGGV